MDNAPDYLRSACEASLQRLGLDYIDIYYIHFPEQGASLELAVAELVKLKQEGKIKAIGISNVTLEQLKEANSTRNIDVVQLEYNMLNRTLKQIFCHIASSNKLLLLHMDLLLLVF
ncbi:aldo/keto reductase [Viridibacillus arvi]|nr:aldo/keto reductase [Viridibacillus sp. JNUCC-6]